MTFLRSVLWLLWSMVFAGRSLGNGHNWATRTVKDQPDHSFYSPGDQTIDQHCEQGREFKYHVPSCGRTDQPFKGEEEQVSKPIDQGYDRTVGIGADQHQPDAQRDQGFKDPEQQPDQLRGFKSEDALFPLRLALCRSNF